MEKTYTHFLTKYLEKNHEGEWERHYDTFNSIEWKNDATPPSEEDVDVGDMNYDGTNNVLDVVLLVNNILTP